MNTIIKLALIVILLSGLLSSCTDTLVVKTKEGNKLAVQDLDDLYYKGDTIFIVKGSSVNGETKWTINDSPAYYRDTTILTNSDYLIEYKKVVVIEEK